LRPQHRHFDLEEGDLALDVEVALIAELA